jgi:hypothetical protein
MLVAAGFNPPSSPAQRARAAHKAFYEMRAPPGKEFIQSCSGHAMHQIPSIIDSYVVTPIF